MAKKKSDPKKYLIVLAVILTVGFLGYGVYSYFSSGAKEKGIIVCNPQDPNKCYWQAHIHTYIIPSVCGETQHFPKEHGELEGEHTHEETDIVHWHDRILINRETGELIDDTSLTLGVYMSSIDVIFSNNCFYGYCNGDICSDGSIGKVKMFVKNKNDDWQQNIDYENYVWQDGDIIYLAFDSRTPNQVLEELKQSNIKFPVLGVG